MKKTIVAPLLIFGLLQLKAQPVRLSYKERDEYFTKPERGFYIPVGTIADYFNKLPYA